MYNLLRPSLSHIYFGLYRIVFWLLEKKTIHQDTHNPSLASYKDHVRQGHDYIHV